MLIDDFVTYYLQAGKSSRTATEYAKEISYFARYLSSQYPSACMEPDELLICSSKEDAYAYMVACLSARNCNQTRARKISALRQFYRIADTASFFAYIGNSVIRSHNDT